MSYNGVELWMTIQRVCPGQQRQFVRAPGHVGGISRRRAPSAAGSRRAFMPV